MSRQTVEARFTGSSCSVSLGGTAFSPLIRGGCHGTLVLGLTSESNKCILVHMNIELEKTNGWELFKALGEPNRFQLFLKLCGCGQPTSVGDIADQVPQDQSVVSRHLKQMQAAGALTSEKQGRQTLYQVNALALARALRSLAEMLENCECCKSGGCCAPGKGESNHG